METDDSLSPTERLVRKVLRAYPVPAWSPGQVTLWAEMLDDLEPVMLAYAVADWIKSRRERPTIADLRKGVAERQLGNAAGGRLFLPQDEAWGYVVRCFGTVGRYVEFPNEHPLVKAAVERLGWKSMCDSTNTEVTRAQFRGAYSALLERSIGEAASSQGAIDMPTALLPLDQQGRLHLADLRAQHETVQ